MIIIEPHGKTEKTQDKDSLRLYLVTHYKYGESVGKEETLNLKETEKKIYIMQVTEEDSILRAIDCLKDELKDNDSIIKGALGREDIRDLQEMKDHLEDAKKTLKELGIVK